jgi:hypothetical protein
MALSGVERTKAVYDMGNLRGDDKSPAEMTADECR